MAYAKIRPRRGTLAEWTMVNPIISEGELVIEHPNTGVGTGPVRFKIGDGFKPYNELPYAFDALAANAIYGGNAYDWHDIIIRSDSYDNWMSEDPILGLAEITYDKTHKKIKVGDGVSPWSKLGYIGPDFNHGDYDFGDEDQIRSDLTNGIPPKEPTPANVVYRPRRGKLNTIINPDTILRDGEMFFEIPPEGMGKNYCKVKIGDGVTPYSELHYAIDPWNCGVEDLPNEPLTFDDTLTNNEIDPLLDKIKSKAGMAQLIENIRACIVWLKTKHNELRTSYDDFYENVITNYLTKKDAADIYLTIKDAADTYLTIDYAKTNYVTFDGEQDLTNKTYNGYTLADACEYNVSDATNAKAFADNDGDHLITERRAYFGTPQFNGSHAYDSSSVYYVHNTKGFREDGYGEAISVSGCANKSSPGPIWKSPSEIKVGLAEKAIFDENGVRLSGIWGAIDRVEGSIPSIDDILEQIKPLLQTSLITPISYHRAQYKERDTVSGASLKNEWFRIQIPNVQIPYSDIKEGPWNTEQYNEGLAAEFAHPMTLLISIQSPIRKKDNITLNRFDCIRADLLTWSPQFAYYRFPKSSKTSNYIKPKRKTIFTVGYAKKKIWDVKWSMSSYDKHNHTIGPSGPDHEDVISKDMIKQREAIIKLTANYKDVTIYEFRLNAGLPLMHYTNMDSNLDKLLPIGQYAKEPPQPN